MKWQLLALQTSGPDDFYFEMIQDFYKRFSENRLFLNTEKTKKMVFDCMTTHT